MTEQDKFVQEQITTLLKACATPLDVHVRVSRIVSERVIGIPDSELKSLNAVQDSASKIQSQIEHLAKLCDKL